jgi:hypothetical protein
VDAASRPAEACETIAVRKQFLPSSRFRLCDEAFENSAAPMLNPVSMTLLRIAPNAINFCDEHIFGSMQL